LSHPPHHYHFLQVIKDKLVFVDIYVDPNEHVYPMLVAPNGSLKDMWLAKGSKT